MKIITKAAIVAAAFAAVPAAAQQTATANLDAAVDNSAAMKAAITQIQTTYKAQIDAETSREAALQTELKPLQDELQRLQGTPGTTQAVLQAKAAALQTRVQAAQREIAGLSAPFARPLAYAREQVAMKLDGAVRAAMQAKNVTLLVQPEAVLAAGPTANLTQDVVTQLDAQVKSVSITPPAGWQPGQGQGPSAAPAAAASAPATAPATSGKKPTSGR
jgi:Skp family chaperone for outer membrane proteins